MEHIHGAKQICLERDANRCRHCGTTEYIDVYQLVDREGRLSWQLSNLVTLCVKCRLDAENNKKENKDKPRVGVMLCGGRGSRLYPLTMFQNKHTLPIGIVPMLFYPLKTLRSFGVYRVLMVVDRDAADQTIAMLGSGKEFGMDISYKVQEGAGGISEALYLAKDFVNPEDDVVCILGDNIFDNSELDTTIDLSSAPFGKLNPLNKYFEKNSACVYLKKVSNPEDYGVAVLEKDERGEEYMPIVTKIVEKPKEFVSDMAVVGLYVYTYDVFNVIDSIKPSARGELEISSVNDHYASEGALLSKEVNGYWADCGGSIQRYAEASMYGAKKANVSVEEIDGFKSVVFDDK